MKIFEYTIEFEEYDTVETIHLQHTNEYSHEEFRDIVTQAIQEQVDYEAANDEAYNKCYQSKDLTENTYILQKNLIEKYGFEEKKDTSIKIKLGHNTDDDRYIREHVKKPETKCRHCHIKEYTDNYYSEIFIELEQRQCVEKHPNVWGKDYHDCMKIC